ncbi:PQQ-binding-like beta-propeller repeat protein [Nannocystis pusilla]|uniref:outer membrane protein assembly factor BamB family protein n=1 Tax=Nannocystis pusilla TaxID=889268 RepID=UPI003DA36665
MLTTGAATGDEPPTSSTTGEPVPAVCGDGVVGDGEACDDGNDEPNDGCDADCTRTGAVAWTVEGQGQLKSLTTAPDGTIYVCTFGVVDEPAHVIAFAPDGTELWTVDAPFYGPLVIGPDEQIVLATDITSVHRFAPDGSVLGSWEQPDGGIVDIAVVGDGLFIASGDLEFEGRMVMRRYDLVTGEIEWESRTPAGVSIEPTEVVAVGERILVPGHLFEDGGRRPMLAAFAVDTGELLSLALDDPANPAWESVASLGGGDLALVGRTIEPDGQIVRRVTADLAAAWTDLTLDTADMQLRPAHVAAGPGGRIAVVGADAQDSWAALVRLFDGEGAVLWTSRFANPAENERDGAVAAEFGAGGLVVGGSIMTQDEDGGGSDQWWLRRFAL